MTDPAKITYTAREMIVLGTLEMCRDQMHVALDFNENMTLSEFIKVFAQNCRNVELMMQRMHLEKATEAPKVDKS